MSSSDFGRLWNTGSLASQRDAGHFCHERYGVQPALRCLAAERCAFLAGRVWPLLRAAGRLARATELLPLPFKLCCRASIRLMTLLGFSSRSTTLTGLPAALRLTRAFRAVSYSSLNFDGSKCAALESRICEASSIMSRLTFGVLMPPK